jgi:hypothetical protein
MREALKASSDGAADSVSPSRAAVLVSWLRRHAYVLVPCLVLAIYAAPSVPYMLPASRSYLGEDYQPVKALKFWKTMGGEYHKYGPMTDILLGPGYALSMAYWWLSGDFSRPSTDFPYGFERPLEQMGFLLLQGRVLFLLLVLASCVAMMLSLRAAGFARWQVALGFMLCFGTSWAAAYYAANTRPEAPQYAFVALALACYVRMLFSPPTWQRAAWMSTWAALAVTAKELAATVFVLPYAAYALWLFVESRKDAELRRQFLPILGAGLGAGLATYAVFNIVYAPVIWWQRIQHWVFGSGLDVDVWGGYGSGRVTLAQYVRDIVEALVSVLGPGGFVFALGMLVSLLVLRPRHWLLLLLPFVSVMVLGLIPIGYVGDRFYAVAAITLVLPGVAGLGALWSKLGAVARGPFAGFAGIALAANLVSATLSWHILHVQTDYQIEQMVRSEPSNRDKVLYMIDPFPALPGASRLEMLGYRVDARSLQEVSDAPFESRPDRIFAPEGGVKFLDEARDELPARAEMLRESGFRPEDWRGLEPLGYRQSAALQPKTPGWFPFDWMQAFQYEHWVSRVLVFDKVSMPPE